MERNMIGTPRLLPKGGPRMTAGNARVEVALMAASVIMLLPARRAETPPYQSCNDCPALCASAAPGLLTRTAQPLE